MKRFIERTAGRDANCHIELTTLIVPGENDSEEEMEQEARWIADMNPDIPLHVTRFFPRYKMKDRSATDVEKIYRLKAVAGKYLKWVVCGELLRGGKYFNKILYHSSKWIVESPEISACF